MSWVRTMLGLANWIYTSHWNLATLPAASVAAGTDDGLPVAIQLVAPAGREKTILALAAQIEQLRPWPQIAPDPEPADPIASMR